MNAPTHTPGPWRFSGIYGVYPDQVYDIEHCDEHSSGPVHCQVHITANNEQARRTAMANASLIAAAPELLEALVRALDYMAPEHNNGHGAKWTKETIEMMKTAIAKAEGAEAYRRQLDTIANRTVTAEDFKRLEDEQGEWDKNNVPERHDGGMV